MAAAALRLRDNALRRRERDLVRVVDARTAQLKEANQSLEDATSQLREANRHLVELSTLDGLTGLVNRRAFDLALEREWERHRRFGTPLSMILADIDCFKKLNDANGHQAGDECLRLVAGALGANGRSGVDCVARYGGEEFVLLLPGVDAAQAARLAEVARARVEQLQLPHPDSVAGRYVTTSLGVATATGQYGNAQALIGAADTALYAAKSRGRNIVVSANDAPGEGSLGQDLRRLGEELQTKALLVGESG
jgi:diguanylate cyclase (GGDEF)-like protein